MMADSPTLEMEPADAPAKRKGVKRRLFLIGGVAVVGAGLFGISMADSNAVKDAAKRTAGKGEHKLGYIFDIGLPALVDARDNTQRC